MNRIDAKFSELKKAGRRAFIAFITAGYPDLPTTAKLVLELERNGADIIELGVPFSDPLADGPVIQEASLHSLSQKTTLNKIISLVSGLRKKTQIPICLMTYYNPVFRMGDRVFADKAAKAGVDGVIIPDLPPEEARDFIAYAGRKGLFNILFLSPTSSHKRIKEVSGMARGFIYYVSLTGVTGSRASLAKDLEANLKKIKRVSRLPVCAGFGISSPGQMQKVQEFCDGGIVGSAIVGRIKKNIGCGDLAHRVGSFARMFNVQKKRVR